MLEMAQICMSTYDAFRVFASGWGNLLELDKIGFYWFDNVIMISLSRF